MTIQNYSADNTPNKVGILPTADEIFIEDLTDIVEKGAGAASDFVQTPGARQPAQAPPESSCCNSRVASITVNVISIALDIASLVVGSAGGAFAYVFGFAYLVLSACGLYGAIVYNTGFVRAAVVGYWVKAVLMILLLIVIGVIVDKDNRYESNGKTYEITIDRTALIIYGVISIIIHLSFTAVNAKLINDITAGIIRNPN